MANHIHILIVDDNEFVRKKIKRILSNPNRTIFEAENGQEALNLIKTTLFDIIFLDIRLPFGVTGLDVFREAQKLRQEKLGKVIILTGSLEDDTRATAEELGVFAFLDKAPFDGDIIIETFNKALL